MRILSNVIEKSNVADEYVATVIGTTSLTLFSFAAATYRGCEVEIIATQGTAYLLTKLLLIHNGTDVNMTEYGTVEIGTFTNKPTFSATYGSSTLVTANSATSTTYKVVYRLIKV